MLPSNSGLGTVVTAVKPRTSMTVGGIEVRTAGAKVDTTSAGNRYNIPVGTHVAVLYFTHKRINGATEVVMLPSTSKL